MRERKFCMCHYECVCGAEEWNCLLADYLEARKLAEEYRNSYCNCTGGDRMNTCNLPWEEK